MSNFENKNLAELSKQDTSIDRLREIINDSTIQTREQIAGYLTLLGLKIENNPSSLEIQKRASQRETLIAELRQAGYPASLNNLPISKLEKLKKIPNGSEVIKNEDLLTMQLEKQQTTINTSVEEIRGEEGPLKQVRNPRLRNAYEKLIHTGIKLDKRLNPPQNIAFNPFARRNVAPQAPGQVQLNWLERRNQESQVRKVQRTKYRIDPLDRGFLARIQIEKAQKLEQRMMGLEQRATAAKIKQRIPELVLQRNLNKRVVDRYEKKIAIAERVVAMRGDPRKIDLVSFNIAYRNANPRPLPFRIIDKMANARDMILYSKKTPISELSIKKPFRRPFFGENGIKAILRTPSAAPKAAKALFQTIKQLSNDLQGKGGGDKK